MPNVICELCGRCECVDPWKICGVCYEMRAKCRRSEDRTRKELLAANQKLLSKTTPGMRSICSVHERRGRKLIRGLNEGSEDES